MNTATETQVSCADVPLGYLRDVIESEVHLCMYTLTVLKIHTGDSHDSDVYNLESMSVNTHILNPCQ